MLSLLAAAALLAAAQDLPAPALVPVDAEANLNGVPVACTGIGLEARTDPRWQSYGVRVELSNARNEYLAGGAVTVRSAAGDVVLRARCDAPWLLLRLAPGRYVIEGAVEGAGTRSAQVTAPRTGQLRVVLQFRDL